MPFNTRSFRPTRRDIFVACVTALCVLVWSQTQLEHFTENRDDVNLLSARTPTKPKPDPNDHLTAPRVLVSGHHGRPHGAVMQNKPPNFMPSTTVLAHHDGWTLFENLYMFDGTLLIVSDEESSSFPQRRLMTSTGRLKTPHAPVHHLITCY